MMEIKQTEANLAGMTLAGVGARTDNKREAGSDGCIPGLWQNFMRAGLSELSGARQPQYVYVLYTDYESDVNGAYTVLIGHEWDSELSASAIEAELTASTLPASRYIVFKAAGAPLPQLVIEAWQYIWAWFESSPHTRTYTGDFERYNMTGFDEGNAEVEIYLAIQ